MQKTLPILLCFLLIAGTLSAQLTLALERSGRDQSDKLFHGDELRFRITSDDLWREGPIQEIRPDINSLVINDRYVKLEEITELDLGASNFISAAGIGLQTFGVGWGFWSLVGYAFDGNPDTSISGGDIAVATTSFAIGFLMTKLNKRRFKVGNNRRLRILDLTF